jgi:anti-sigma factor RsiW
MEIIVIEDAELTGYFDGELSPDRTQAVERALAADLDLAAKLTRLRATDELLSKSARNILSDHSLIALSDEGKTLRPAWLIRTPFGTTVLVLALVIVKFVISSMEPWMATALELTLLATLLILAVTRFQSMANDDQKHVEEALNSMSSTAMEG